MTWAALLEAPAWERRCLLKGLPLCVRSGGFNKSVIARLAPSVVG